MALGDEDTMTSAAEAPAARPSVGAARWALHLALIAAYPLVIGALGWSRASSNAPLLAHDARHLLLACAVELSFFGLVFLLAWLASRVSREDLLLRWPGGLWPVPLALGYSLALRVVVAVVMLAASAMLLALRLVTRDALTHLAARHGAGVQALVDLPAMRHDPLYYWLMVTLVSFVVAGLREELWRSAFLTGMRHLWPRLFGSRRGQIRAVAVAALIFGAAHVAMGPLAMVVAALLGFGLGLIMILHRSVWPAVIAHGAFDATSLALIPWLAELAKSYQGALWP
jgi:membrane protease YdiL (CAAX protease family)